VGPKNRRSSIQNLTRATVNLSEMEFEERKLETVAFVLNCYNDLNEFHRRQQVTVASLIELNSVQLDTIITSSKEDM